MRKDKYIIEYDFHTQSLVCKKNGEIIKTFDETYTMAQAVSWMNHRVESDNDKVARS